MRTILALLLSLVVTFPAVAQTPTERVDQVLMIGSISMSSVALGLTMSCTSDGSCRELNPVMQKFLGDGPVRATVVKSAVVGTSTYLIWRTQRGRRRTLLLASMFALNAWDAIHDIREVRKLTR